MATGPAPFGVIEKINGEEVLFFRRIGEMLVKLRVQEKIELLVTEFRLDDQKEKSRTWFWTDARLLKLPTK